MAPSAFNRGLLLLWPQFTLYLLTLRNEAVSLLLQWCILPCYQLSRTQLGYPPFRRVGISLVDSISRILHEPPFYSVLWRRFFSIVSNAMLRLLNKKRRNGAVSPTFETSLVPDNARLLRTVGRLLLQPLCSSSISFALHLTCP